MDNYAMGGGNLLTGLMSGFAKGRNDKLNREMMDKQIKMAQAQAKIKQAENVQKQEEWTRKMAQEARVNAAREAFFTAYGIPSPTGQPQGQVAGQGQPQDIAQAPQPQGGILDAMTSGPPSLGFGFPGQPQQSDRTFLSGGNEGSPQIQTQLPGQPQGQPQPQSPPQRSLTELLSNPGAMMALQESTGINLIPIANAMTNRGKLEQTIANETADNTREDEKFESEKWFKGLNYMLNKNKFEAEQTKITWKPDTVDGQPGERAYFADGTKANVEPRVLGMTPEDQVSLKAKQNVTSIVGGMINAYKELNDLGAITNVDKSSVENILASLSASETGQKVTKWLGKDSQSIRTFIESNRANMINEIRQAKKMGAKGMDSEKELDFFLKTVSATDQDIQSNLAILAVLDENIGTGEAAASLQKMGDKSLLKRIDMYKKQLEVIRENDETGELTPEKEKSMDAMVGG